MEPTRHSSKMMFLTLCGIVSPAHGSLQKTKNGGSANKYWVFESCEVTVSDLQNALTEGDAILRKKASLTSTEEALILEEFLWKQTADRECQAT